MDKHLQGAYAFPQPIDADQRHPDYNGMMLRDYFAAKALNGMLSATTEKHAHGSNFSKNEIEYYSETSYLFADAMLAQREKSTNP